LVLDRLRRRHWEGPIRQVAVEHGLRLSRPGARDKAHWLPVLLANPPAVGAAASRLRLLARRGDGEVSAIWCDYVTGNVYGRRHRTRAARPAGADGLIWAPRDRSPADQLGWLVSEGTEPGLRPSAAGGPGQDDLPDRVVGGVIEDPASEGSAADQPDVPSR
jgi:hypothetical protein